MLHILGIVELDEHYMIQDHIIQIIVEIYELGN